MAAMVARLTLALVLVLALIGWIGESAPATAQEAEVIRSFDADYEVRPDGTVLVTEDIQYDFGSLQRHGIFREIVVEQKFDAGHNRIYRVRVLSVDNGRDPVPYTTSRISAVLQLKIGEPDRFVTGAQRYRIRYELHGALNSQPDSDELFWNATGNSWLVPIERASVSLTAPSIDRVTCFEGPTGSTRACTSRSGANTADFSMTRPAQPGGGLTIVVALTKGTVSIPPFELVEIKTVEQQVRDFVGLEPLPIALAGLVGLGSFGALLRYWWLFGRDRWLGDVHYLTGATQERKRPLFARDTVVVEYQPPQLQARGRRLRPAEIGTLMDEEADTLDVTATIVDLAVRGYLRITELPKSWLFGKVDYKLERLKPAGDELLPYEQLLLDSLFDEGNETTMGELRNEFYSDLAKVKESLYEQVSKEDAFFPGSPEKARQGHLVGGAALTAAGAGVGFGLGQLVGAAIVGLPIALTGLALAAFSKAMPRRTAAGREMFRRCLGFREYMTVAETDRQRFAEEENIFEAYLPYAMVYGCVDKWAEAFEGIENVPQTTGWYVASHAFAPIAFSRDLEGFSSSISSAITSTPGGSGGSGFSGGGSSGGGGGGGGGGSW